MIAKGGFYVIILIDAEIFAFCSCKILSYILCIDNLPMYYHLQQSGFTAFHRW